MYQAVSHIDNISYTFQLKAKNKDKLIIDWGLVRAIFHKYGEVTTPYGNIGQYKHYDPHNRYSYKVYGNMVTVSIAKKVFECYETRDTYYFHLVRAVKYLFDNMIIRTKWACTRQATYYLLRSRGTIRIEHAIDIYGLQSSEQARSIDTLGKRYQRTGFTRYEIITKGKIDDYRPQLKSINITNMFMKKIVMKHVKNLYTKSSNILLTALCGKMMGDNRQANYRKLAVWVEGVIRTADYSLIKDTNTLRQLVFKEKQNII